VRCFSPCSPGKGGVGDRGDIATTSELTAWATPNEKIHLLICVHLHYGKFTVIGRLLADLRALAEGELDEILDCFGEMSWPFESSLGIPTLTDEQSQCIRNDTAQFLVKHGGA
jgi:sulfate adenylyltransferase subunit 1 (EFTu-like GTPase family)